MGAPWATGACADDTVEKPMRREVARAILPAGEGRGHVFQPTPASIFSECIRCRLLEYAAYDARIAVRKFARCTIITNATPRTGSHHACVPHAPPWPNVPGESIAATPSCGVRRMLVPMTPAVIFSALAEDVVLKDPVGRSPVCGVLRNFIASALRMRRPSSVPPPRASAEARVVGAVE